MGNKKMKDDEKIEKTIRALLKLPENKRCINCNLLGPQYVCTTFLTFVCTTCSGIHREFTHRVKSVSMAKFSEEDVSALQAAGNERAREIYFKTWDPQRNSFPDASNHHRLRDFIKHVYVDRKYTGERNDRRLSLRLGHRADSSRVSVFSGRSRSPLYEDKHERNSNEGSISAGRSDCVRGFYDETRSPRYAQENSRYGGSIIKPLCIEIVDNRCRYDDGPGSARRQDKHSVSQTELVTRRKSSGHQIDRSGSPVVHSVRDTLGENTPALQVGEHSKANNGRDAEGLAKNQNTLQDIASFGGMESLIDFGMDSDPSNALATQNMLQVPPSDDGSKQSSDEFSSKGKAPPASKANTLESLLFGLSAPAVDNVSAVRGTAGVTSTASRQNISLHGVSPAAPAEQLLALPSTDGSSTVPPVTNVPQKPSNVETLQSTIDINCDSRVKAPDQHVFPNLQKYQSSSAFSASDNSFSAQESGRTVEELNSQSDTSLLMHNDQQASTASTEQSSQVTSKTDEETRFEVGVQPLSAETNSSGRRELPEDLFTVSYVSAPAAVPGWQNGLPHGTGFGLQYYPNAVQAAAFPSTGKANPFDLNSDTAPTQASQFPSMASLLGDLSSVQGHTGLSHGPSFNATSHSSYLASVMTPKLTSTFSMPSSAYMGDQSRVSMPLSRPQGIDSFGSDEFASAVMNDEFTSGSLSTSQRPTVGHLESNPPDLFPPTAANPFG